MIRVVAYLWKHQVDAECKDIQNGVFCFVLSSRVDATGDQHDVHYLSALVIYNIYIWYMAIQSSLRCLLLVGPVGNYSL